MWARISPPPRHLQNRYAFGHAADQQKAKEKDSQEHSDTPAIAAQRTQDRAYWHYLSAAADSVEGGLTQSSFDLHSAAPRLPGGRR